MVALLQQITIAIQYQHSDMSWLQITPIQHVCDTPERARDDMRASREAFPVFADGGAANAGVARNTAGREERCRVQRKFARRGHDQH